jgi:hypothetical protein
MKLIKLINYIKINYYKKLLTSKKYLLIMYYVLKSLLDAKINNLNNLEYLYFYCMLIMLYQSKI